MMFTTRPDLIGTFGAVASTHWLASTVAMGVLERGGNAFDAAISAGLVLQVAEPHLNGPGGDLSLLLHRSDRDETLAICGQGVAPAAANPEHFRQLGLQRIPGSGLLPATVPGAMDAWLLLLRDHGTMTLEQVFEPALHYAERGVPVLPGMHNAIATVQTLFREHWQGSASVWLPGNQVPRTGELITNQRLAVTWRRLINEARVASHDRDCQIEAARDTWYTGFIAGAIDRFYRRTLIDCSGVAHQGLLCGDDMVDWRACYEHPAAVRLGEKTVYKCGPWSQGPLMLQVLQMLYPHKAMLAECDEVTLMHWLSEACKLAFADRDAHYADPRMVDVPLRALLDERYAQQRAALIDPQCANFDLRPGQPDPKRPVRWPTALPELDPHATDFIALGAGEPTVHSSGLHRGDTCQLDVVDSWGNVVAATPSGGWLQSSPLIPELGFCLGTRGQMFWLEEGLPNTLAPFKRPRTTLSPTLVRSTDNGFIACGTPGGDQQESWQLLFLLRHLWRGQSMQQAIDAPAGHIEHYIASFYPRQILRGRLCLEERFATTTLDALRALGHDLDIRHPWSEGRLCAVALHNGTLRAAANPRGMQNYALCR